MNYFKNVIKSAVFALMLSNLSAPALAQEGSPQTQAIENYGKLLKAQGDFAKALAEARLNHAKANLIDATTAGQWVKVRQLNILVERLNLEMRRLRRDEALLRRKAAKIERDARSVNVILSGRITDSSLRAMRLLQITTIPAHVTREAMTLSVGELDDLELIPIAEGALVIPFKGGNVGQLINHLQRHRLTLQPWGVGHGALVDAIVIQGSGVNQGLTQVEEAFAKLYAGADPFDLTKPWELERPI